MKKNINIGMIALGAIILLMGAEIIYLTYQNRQLKAMLDDPSRFFEKTLQAGDSVPAVRAEDINGNEFSLTYSETAPYTLILWFSPTCSSCEDNIGLWNDIYRAHVPEKLRIVGFCACAAAEGREAATANALQFPVLAVTEQSIVDMYKGNLLPQTVLIAPSGQIIQVWPGALLDRQKNEVLASLRSIGTIKMEGGE